MDWANSPAVVGDAAADKKRVHAAWVAPGRFGIAAACTTGGTAWGGGREAAQCRPVHKAHEFMTCEGSGGGRTD